MASAAIPHREQTPIMVWLRNKLLASVNRSGAAGLPGPDGKVRYFSYFCFDFLGNFWRIYIVVGSQR